MESKAGFLFVAQVLFVHIKNKGAFCSEKAEVGFCLGLVSAKICSRGGGY